MRSAATAVTGPGHTVPTAGAASPAASSGYWHRAELVVLVMMTVVAVRIHEFFPGIGPLKPVFTITVFGFIMLWKNTPQRIRANVLGRPLNHFVLLYLGVITLTIPTALWSGGALAIARSMLPAILLFAAFQMIPPTRSTLDRMQFGFILLVLFFSWYQQTFGRVWLGRLVVTGGSFDENDVASILAMALPMAIAVLMRVRGTRPKVLSAMAIVAVVGGVVATGSRGGLLALVAGAIVFVLGLNSTKATLAIYFMGLGAGLVWFTAPPMFKNRVRSLTNLENDYNMTAETGRKAVWRRGRQYIKEYPILGVGAGNFFVAEGNYNEEVGRTGKWSAAHNAYIQAYAELGLIGGTVFVLMLLSAAWIALSFWRRKSNWGRGPPFHRPEYLAALAAYSVGAIFLSHAYFTPLFAVLGLTSLADRTRDTERRGGIPAVEPTGIAAPAAAPERGKRGGLSGTGSYEGRGRGSRGSPGGRGGLTLRTRTWGH